MKAITLLLLLTTFVPLQAESKPAKKNAATVLTADALVAKLYREHDAKRSPFFQHKNRALLDLYFEQSLATMIWKDAGSDEVGALDGDPLYDAQDIKISKFVIGAATVDGDKAKVIVTFSNYDEGRRLTFHLQKLAGSWKIDDIDYGNGYTLRSLFKTK